MLRLARSRVAPWDASSRRNAMLSRRRFLKVVAAAGAAPQVIPFAPPAAGQVVAKPARVLVGFPPGAATDAVARLLVEHMKGYASSLIVENRLGAGGRL